MFTIELHAMRLILLRQIDSDLVRQATLMHKRDSPIQEIVSAIPKRVCTSRYRLRVIFCGFLTGVLNIEYSSPRRLASTPHYIVYSKQLTSGGFRARAL